MIYAMIVAGLMAVLVAAAASATEVEYGVDIGIGASDNVARLPIAQESEAIATAGLDLRLIRQDRKIDALIDADLFYLDYQDDTFDSEVLGTAFVDIRAQIVPDHFEWVLINSFSQSELDPFVVPTPENRENVNYFMTGPDLTMRLGSQTTLTTLGRGSLSEYEESNFDDERLLGGISLARELSAFRNVSLNVTTERVEFDDPEFGSNYDRHSVFLRYEIDGARTRIGAEGGYTEIHDLGDIRSSPLFEIDFVRDISDRSSLTLRGGVRSSDAATVLLAGNIRGTCLQRSFDEISSPDPFDIRHATLCWQFQTPRTDITLWARYEENAYERELLLDRTTQVFMAFAERQFTSRVSVGAQAVLNKNDYDATNRDYDGTLLGVYLSWNVVGRLYFEVDIERFSRDGENPLNEFDENRGFIRLAWRSRRGIAEAR